MKNTNYSPIDDERPLPETRETVRRVAASCRLDPRATPRSNQARLLFALYDRIGLDLPYGWREACVGVLAEHGIPATTLSLDLLFSAMLTEEVVEFDGWPGIDRRLVNALRARLR
jgi:hypothetical protein